MKENTLNRYFVLFLLAFAQTSFANKDSVLVFDVFLNSEKIGHYTDGVSNIISIKESTLKPSDTLYFHFNAEKIPDSCIAKIVIAYGSANGIGYPMEQGQTQEGVYSVAIQKIKNIPSMHSKVFYVNYVLFRNGKYFQWRTLFTLKFEVQ